MEQRTFNLKATFRNGKLDKLEKGNFGESTPNVKLEKNYVPSMEDQLLSWPIDPEFTGPSSIVNVMRWPVTDRFFQNGMKEFGK